MLDTPFNSPLGSLHPLLHNTRMNQIPNSLVKRIVADCRHRLAKVGGKVVLDHKNHNLGSDDEENRAFFTCDPLLVKVSVKDWTNNAWVPALLHEMSHFDQWNEDAKVWTDCFIEGNDVSDIAELWMKRRIELTFHQRMEVLGAIAKLELDAEKRAVEKMYKWDLVNYVDIPSYIQQANAYVEGYYMVAYIRQWFPVSRSPDQISSLVSKFPRDFIVTQRPSTSDWISAYPDFNWPHEWTTTSIYLPPTIAKKPWYKAFWS